jgi:ubiquitin carboxyl-terminal hydrolase 10
LTKSNDTVALPYLSNASNEVQQSEPSPEQATSVKAEEPASETSTVAATSARETPATSQAPSESDFNQASTPTTPAQATTSSPEPSGASVQQHARKDTRTAIAVPNIGALPKTKPTSPSAEKQPQHPPAASSEAAPAQTETSAVDGTAETAPETPKSPTKPAAPKSWADLVRTKEAKTATAAAQANSTTVPNGVKSVPKSAPLAEALRQHTVTNDTLSFLEPRGLVNPGNMCYMNSVSSAMDYNVGMTLTNG